jgi:hypothetical protein
MQRAWALLREEGIEGVLVGTAALQLHGYEVEAPDIDFLTDGRKPSVAQYVEDYTGGSTYHLDNVKVDYIAEDAYSPARMLYFHPERAVRIAGILVAALEDVVGLKHWRGRPKDHATLFDLGLHPDQQPSRPQAPVEIGYEVPVKGRASWE